MNETDKKYVAVLEALVKEAYRIMPLNNGDQARWLAKAGGMKITEGVKPEVKPLYLQQCGRIKRTNPGEIPLVLDHVGNQ